MILKHLQPPSKDKLKAHYFDRYAENIDGSKLLSSVGDQSREVQNGRCYNFDGVDDYVETLPIQIFEGDDFSAECYINATSFVGQYNAIFGQRWLGEGTNKFGFLILDDDRLSFQYGVGGGSMQPINSIEPLLINTTYHIKVIHQNNVITLFINNEEIASQDSTNLIVDTLYTFTIGRQISNVNPYHFRGKIWGVKIYSYTRNKFLLQMNCDESDGLTCYDSSGNNYHGTIKNASLSTFHSTQDVYSFQNENGFSKNVSPIDDTTLDVNNWDLPHLSWSFSNVTAIHTATVDDSPRYFRIKPEKSIMVAGVTYLAEMDVISTTGSCGFGIQGGISTSGGRRTTAGKISHQFISDGGNIEIFALGTVNCVIANVKVTVVGLVPAKNSELDIFNKFLSYKGQVSYNALLKQSNCVNLDGVDDYIETSTKFDFIHQTGIFDIEFYASFTGKDSTTSLSNPFQTKWGGTENGIRIGTSNLFGLTENHNTFFVSLNNVVVVRSFPIIFTTSDILHVRVVGDGVDVKIFINDTESVRESSTIVLNSGTSEQTLNFGRGGGSGVHQHQGKIFGVKIKDGSGNLLGYYPMAEGAGGKVYDIVGGNHGTLMNTSATIWDKQDTYHYNIQHQFSTDVDGTKIPTALKNVRNHNGAETIIDFTGGKINDFSKNLPVNYIFGDTTIDLKRVEENKESNILIYENSTESDLIKIKNYLKIQNAVESPENFFIENNGVGQIKISWGEVEEPQNFSITNDGLGKIKILWN